MPRVGALLLPEFLPIVPFDTSPTSRPERRCPMAPAPTSHGIPFFGDGTAVGTRFPLAKSGSQPPLLEYDIAANDSPPAARAAMRACAKQDAYCGAMP